MRYLNWDVLIFAETGDTKTPLQEFGTACTVTQDPDATQMPNNAHPAYLTVVTHPLPTLSCFIPSLPHGCPFRVSLHSWQIPVASRATVSLAPQESMIGFEAKVLLDGKVTAGTLFNQDPSWPQVIDTYSFVDNEGNHDKLRFPFFHTSVMTQAFAHPDQNMGKINIVIAEGIHHGPGTPAFEKTRNVVAFSFQHAPLYHLENCGIAWPNPGMYYQAAEQFQQASSPRTKPADPEAHAHSPRRHDGPKTSIRSKLNSAMAPPPVSYALVAPSAIGLHGLHRGDPFWSQQGPIPDPFIENAAGIRTYRNMSKNSAGSGDILMLDQSRSTSSSHDVPMPGTSRAVSPNGSNRTHPMYDYSGPISMANSRNISEYANFASDGHGVMRIAGMLGEHEELNHFNEMFDTFTPRKSSLSGISAPSNTRNSSADNSPPNQLPGAAGGRAFSYDSNPFESRRVVSVTTRDPPPTIKRVTSNTSAKSRKSDARQLETHNEPGEKAESKIRKKPAPNVKSRKEGRPSEIENEVPAAMSQSRTSAASKSGSGKENMDGTNGSSGEKANDSKRKRVSIAVGLQVPLQERLDNQDDSPTRKISKFDVKAYSLGCLEDMDDLTEEGVIVRPPLADLHNLL